MTSLARVAGYTLPRQYKKAKSCVLDLGLDVLDLEENVPWGIIAANQNLKISSKFDFHDEKMKIMM